MITKFTDWKAHLLNEGVAANDKTIEKKVDDINKMILKAIDSDNDPISVIDKSGTWQEPMVYKPIIYKNGMLTIEYYEVYSPKKIKKEKINKSNMELDGIGTLNDIAKMYRAALKKHNITID